MAKKSGRPPKTPSSQSKKTVGKAGNNVGTPSKVDFGDLDDEDLDDINNLSPKQAELLMKKIDLLRAKIQERASNNDKSTEGSGEKEKDADQSNPNTEIPSSGNPLSDADKEMTDKDLPKRPNIEIDQVVGALKLQEAITNEILPPENVESARQDIEKVMEMATVNNQPKQSDKGKAIAVEDEEGWIPGVWDKPVVGSYMFQVCKKLISLQKPFRDLNKRAFKGIDSQEMQIREELDLVQSAIMQNPDDTNLHSREKDLTRRYLEVKEAAFAFLRQKGKLNWLIHGDENSKIFHNSIKQRLYQNRIVRLQTDQGLINEHDQIATAFQTFYADLFTHTLNRNSANEAIFSEGI
ncbi:hypothetical protein RIF29_20710 [Crotalaria pallida]|uniref:Uncharacterized protein n=1 Tax=Crotalaria pallida TaxID=3830 RepID=A0AAN9I6K4_CROPI